MVKSSSTHPPHPAAADAGACAGTAAACAAQGRGCERAACPVLVRLAQAAAGQWGDTAGPPGWWAEEGYTFIEAFVRAYEACWDAAQRPDRSL